MQPLSWNVTGQCNAPLARYCDCIVLTLWGSPSFCCLWSLNVLWLMWILCFSLRKRWWHAGGLIPMPGAATPLWPQGPQVCHLVHFIALHTDCLCLHRQYVWLPVHVVVYMCVDRDGKIQGIWTWSQCSHFVVVFVQSLVWVVVFFCYCCCCFWGELCSMHKQKIVTHC